MKRTAIWGLAAILAAGSVPAGAAQASSWGVAVVHGATHRHAGEHRRIRKHHRESRHRSFVHRHERRTGAKYRRGHRHKYRYGHRHRHRYWVPGHYTRRGFWVPGQWVLVWGQGWPSFR